MNNSQFLPSIIGSIFFGMIFHKIYMKNDEKKIERFVSHPLVNNKETLIQYNTANKYNPKDEANAFYKVSSIPAKKDSDPSSLDKQAVPLPKTSDGTVPKVFVPDRRPGFYYGVPRGLADGDYIRGDLNFEAKSICPMFNYATIREERLNPGFLNKL